MTIIDLYKWLWLAVATGLTDLCWTLYITNATENNRWRASLYSVGILLLGSSVILEYVSDRILIIPAAIGAFLGTWIPLTLRKK